MNSPELLQSDFDRVQNRALAVGVAGLALCAGGAYFNPTQFFRSYLLAFLFWLGIALGCVALAMLHHMTGGGWGFVIRRFLESGASTFPLLALLALPALLGYSRLYPWVHQQASAGEPVPALRRAYLNTPAFFGRAAFYFAVWMTLGYLLNKWSSEQDRTADPALTDRLQSLSGPGLVVFGFTATFAAVDWAMSLEPHWTSTIYGIMFIVAEGLAALAFSILVARLLAHRKPLADVIAPSHFHDLGNLLLAFVMLWAYIGFSQFLIIWSGNLQEEIPWYLSRASGGWAALALFLVVFHFALPFLLLLSRDIKRRMQVLAVVAATLLAMGLVDLFWLVAPAFDSAHAGPHVHWMDLMAPVGVGGIWIAWFVWQLKGKPLLPLHDPRFQGAFSHGN